MDVLEVVPAGSALIAALINIFEDFDEVGEIRTDMLALDDEDKLGCVNPVTCDIVIDMGNCVLCKSWMKKGATMIANVWFNLLFAAFHERAHVRQIRENAKLKELEHATEIMEATANAEANSALLLYVKNNPIIPSLDELGCSGDYLKDMFTERYALFPEHVNRELEFQNTKIAGVWKRPTDEGEEIYSVDSVALLSAIIGPPPDDEVIEAKENADAEDGIRQKAFEAGASVSPDRVDEEASDEDEEQYEVTYA